MFFTFQVMVLGDSGVGKTCLLVRFRDDMFLGGNYISTVGVDFRVRRSIVFELNMNRGTRLICQWLQYKGHSFVLTLNTMYIPMISNRQLELS